MTACRLIATLSKQSEAFRPPEDYVGRFSRPWKSSDLVLQVGDREFHVHRAVLILSSPVFESMLSSNFKEKFAKEIRLPGKNPTEIEQFLQGIYPDEDLWIFKGNCLSLLKLSPEYQVSRLKKRCEEYLSHWYSKDMTGDEALEVIIFNQTYPLEEEIIEKCVNKFARQRNLAWVEIRKHRLYPELEPKTVEHLIEARMDHLEQQLDVGSTDHCENRWRKSNFSKGKDQNLNKKETDELRSFRM